MKHLSTLLVSVLSIGSLLSAGSVCAMSSPGSDGYVRPSAQRISKRTLNKSVRASWRHIESKTKGY